VRAYKFLDEDGRAPFTGVAWPVGEWLDAGAAVPCHDGLHACRADDVSRWIAAAMWHVELDGDVADTAHKVVATRGRLIGPVEGYDDAMRELRELSAWRCRDRAVSALGEAGARDRDALAAVGTLDELATWAVGDDSTFAGRAAALAADCAHFALHGTHAQAPFVAACSAGHVAAGAPGDQDAFDAGYEQERAFQSEWLTRRLWLA
jgi:hypothetical protein